MADKDGNVDMTLQAISRRTTIPLEIIEKGVAVLLLPDPESRTPTLDGKRIIPLVEGRNWGWSIVNYQHYSKLKNEEERRDYHRNYWHKRKDKLNTTQHTQQNSNDSTHIDTDINTDTKKKKNRASPFAPPVLDEVAQFIREGGFTVSAAKFIDYYTSNGWRVGKNPMKNWQAAVRNWQKREIENEENKPDNRSRAKRVADTLDEIAREDIKLNGFTGALG